MPLDRQSIEKKDFPIGRRGYDPEAVDAHLASLAGEVDDLRRSSRKRTDTLAAAASEQVRAIVEAAEKSAAEIAGQADAEANEIRSEAVTEAARSREQAQGEARTHVGRVSEASATLLTRIDGMETELHGLLETLRTGANRLNADLSLLEGNMDELKESAGARRPFQPEPAPATSVPEPAPEPEPEPEPAPAAPAAAPSGKRKRGGAAAADPAEDVEGARLIALNMALNGSPREEIDGYLAEHFQLANRAKLLDEVYASVDA